MRSNQKKLRSSLRWYNDAVKSYFGLWDHPQASDSLLNLRTKLENFASQKLHYSQKVSRSIVMWLALYAAKDTFTLNESVYKQLVDVVNQAASKPAFAYMTAAEKKNYTLEGMKPLRSLIAELVAAEKSSVADFDKKETESSKVLGPNIR